MRNKDFQAHFQAWVLGHGLRPSRRPACGHGVLGRGTTSDAHELLCLPAAHDLLARATLWNVNKTRLLVAFPYGPRPDEPGHESYLYRVTAYANRLGLTAYMPPARNRLHALYATDTCVVLYGMKGVDLRPFSEGVSRSWVQKPEPTIPRSERWRERERAQARVRAAARRAELS